MRGLPRYPRSTMRSRRTGHAQRFAACSGFRRRTNRASCIAVSALLCGPDPTARGGVARSGAYNRSLTPFGFQSERRTADAARESVLHTLAEEFDWFDKHVKNAEPRGRLARPG